MKIFIKDRAKYSKERGVRKGVRKGKGKSGEGKSGEGKSKSSRRK